LLVMTVQSWIHMLWIEPSLSFVLAAPFGAIWLSVVGCVCERLRHCGTLLCTPGYGL
jgi:hypothetical protein